MFVDHLVLGGFEVMNKNNETAQIDIALVNEFIELWESGGLNIRQLLVS